MSSLVVQTSGAILARMCSARVAAAECGRRLVNPTNPVPDPHADVLGDVSRSVAAVYDATRTGEFSATLATWFGVSAIDLPAVLPSIERFARPSLGFIA